MYLVVFRSVRNPEADDDLIVALDDAALAEAGQSPALLHYFASEVEEESRKAMSWCLWTDMQAARDALSGSAHQEAASRVHELYDNFSLEVYNVTVSEQGVDFAPYAPDAK
jgi:hypothetical protein